MSDYSLVKTLTGLTNEVYSVAFSLDGNEKLFYSLIGNYLASASSYVDIWKMSDYSLVKILTGHKNAVMSVAFSPDGN